MRWLTVIFRCWRRLEIELEDIEDKIFVKDSASSNIERLYQLKRKVMVLRHAVAPLMEDGG